MILNNFLNKITISLIIFIAQIGAGSGQFRLKSPCHYHIIIIIIIMMLLL